MPSNKNAEQITRIVQQQVEHQLSITREHRSGPLPDAEELQRYENIRPGFADELLTMAKKSQENMIEAAREEREMQRQFLESHQKHFGRGQIVGTIVALSALAVGGFIAYSGAPKEGAAVVGATMLILGGAFAWGKYHEVKSADPKGE